MWFVDIVLDLPWFTETHGRLPCARSRSVAPADEVTPTLTYLLYGDDAAIRHLRVMIDQPAEAAPHDVVNAHVQRWVNLLEVASGLAAPQTATTASLGRDNAGMMVMLSPGDEDAPGVDLTFQMAQPPIVDYAAAASLMTVWNGDFRVHLFYLGRFLNHQLPPEVRWLNGYRLLEWHFRRGQVGLAKDQAYRDFLGAHGGALDFLLNPRQDRRGLIEEVRAIAAHAILSRTADARNAGGAANLITSTFAALEQMVMAVMNEGAAGAIAFGPAEPIV